MADVFYPGTLAADPGTVGRSPLPNAVFQVFELTDTAQVNPLPLKDSSGLSITSLASTSLGVLPPVYVTSPNLSHNWVSGTWVWRRDSFDGAQAAVTAAKNASISGASLSPAGDLSFTTLGGTVIPAGNVKGPQGSPGSNTVPTDTAIKNVVTDPASQTAGALNATFVPRWKANTAYAAGDPVLAPGGDTVTAKTGFTSGASYNAANWNLSSMYAITDGTPRLMKALGDSRAGLVDWEIGAGQAGYLFHLRAGLNSIVDEYAIGIGLDDGSGGGILISQKTSGGIGINLGQWPGTGVGILASNRSSTPIMNTEIYAGAGGVIYSLKSGQGRSDGVLTSGSPIMTSATAAFTAADIGRTVQTTQPKPNDLPAGTTIVSVESATSVTLSQNATATRTGVRFMILGRIAASTQTLMRFYDTDTTTDLFAIRQGSIMSVLPFIGRDAGTSVLRVYGSTGQSADLQSWRDVNTNRLSRINKDGRIMSSRNTLPAVADLDIGEWTLHGDPTTGAEKIYLSIRNSAGNLVTKDLTL